MPKYFQHVIDQVNALTVIDGPLLKKRAASGSSNKQTPSYIESDLVRRKLGRTVLSLFGGADITALKCPEVANLIIVDNNLFVSKSTITQHCAEDEADGLFHKYTGLFLLAHSPYLFATMACLSDYCHPFAIYNRFQMRMSELLYDQAYRDQLEIPHDDPLFNFINETTRDDIENAWRAPQEPKIPVTDLADIGLSTIILYRIRYCLDAKIISIEEVCEDKLFCIRILRPDGSEASIYYASCLFGGSKLDQTVLQIISSYTRQQLGGISSVLIRGYPSDFFGSEIKGSRDSVAKEVSSLVQASAAVPAEELACVICTNKGDKFPDIFTNPSEVTSISFPKTGLYDTEELVMVSNGQCFGFEAHSMNGDQSAAALPKPMTATGLVKHGLFRTAVEFVSTSSYLEPTNPGAHNNTLLA